MSYNQQDHITFEHYDRVDMIMAVTDSFLLELNNKFYKEAMKILILS